MPTPFQTLFLHFLNRELKSIHSKRWTDGELNRWTKVIALSTAGTLIAPFGQVHELSHSSPSLIRLVASLVSNGKLALRGPASDVWSFFDHRRELYSLNRTAYRNYYDTKYNRLLSDYYSPSRHLNTTRHLKERLASISIGIQSNIVSSEEASFAKSHQSFLTSELQDSTAAATYSIYLRQKIEPQPEVSLRLGNISSRLFQSRYLDIHAAATPTGFFSDPLIEDFDHFPFYDLRTNFTILQCIGLDRLVSDEQTLSFFTYFYSNADVCHFVEMKDMLITSILGKLKDEGVAFPTIDNIVRELRSFSFSPPTAGFTTQPNLYAEVVTQAISKKINEDDRYAKAVSHELKEKVSRVTVVIFTATNIEDEVFRAKVVKRGFTPAGRIKAGDVYAVKYALYDRIHLLHVRTGMGSSGVHGSQRVSHDFFSEVKTDIEMAIAIGVCFGISRDSQALGDVVVAESFNMYEPAKIKGGAMQFRGDRIPSEPRLVSYGHACRSDMRDHNIHIGPVLTGEKLVDDPLFRQTILSCNLKAVGGEMEAGGIVATCQSKGVRFAMVKGICDFAESKSDDVQERAASNAAEIALDFIIETWNS